MARGRIWTFGEERALLGYFRKHPNWDLRKRSLVALNSGKFPGRTLKAMEHKMYRMCATYER